MLFGSFGSFGWFDPDRPPNRNWFKRVDGQIAFYPLSLLGGRGYFVDEAMRHRIELILAAWEILGCFFVCLSLAYVYVFLQSSYALLVVAGTLLAVLLLGAGVLRLAVIGRPSTAARLTWRELTEQDARRASTASLVWGVICGITLLFFGTMLLAGRRFGTPLDLIGGIAFALIGIWMLANAIDVIHARSVRAQMLDSLEPAVPEDDDRPA